MPRINEMELKKVKDTYNTYSVKLSFGQLVAIRDALKKDHSDPLSDEVLAEIEYYLNNLPGPGEDPEDYKEEKRSGEEGKKADREEARDTEKVETGQKKPEPTPSNIKSMTPPPQPSGGGSGLSKLMSRVKGDRAKRNISASMLNRPGRASILQDAATLVPPPPQ